MHDTEHVAFHDDQTVASAHAAIAAQGTRGLPARLGNRPRASPVAVDHHVRLALTSPPISSPGRVGLERLKDTRVDFRSCRARQ
jgi:hypothetical protein